MKMKKGGERRGKRDSHTGGVGAFCERGLIFVMIALPHGKANRVE